MIYEKRKAQHPPGPLLFLALMDTRTEPSARALMILLVRKRHCQQAHPTMGLMPAGTVLVLLTI
jgi:hypothetical protein